MIFVGIHSCLGKELVWGKPLQVLHVGHIVVCIVCVSESVGPQVYHDGLRPLSVIMQEHGSGTFLQLSDPAFCPTILVVRSNSSKRECLTRFVACLNPGSRLKYPIV